MSHRRPCPLHGPGCRGPWSSLPSRERARITAVLLETKGRACWVRGCTTPASTADHLIPDSVSHDHRLANLRPSCLHHNQARGAGPSGDGTYGARLTLVTGPASIPVGPDDLTISARAISDALGLPTQHPVTRAAITAATRAAARLTTPTHVIVIDPTPSPSDLAHLEARGATVVGPTPSASTAPTPSRPW